MPPQHASATAIVCTGNRHKVEELGHLLPCFELRPLSASVVLPPETGETFEENARIKAVAGRKLHRRTWVVADDSGLEVDALGGAPGVRSARFAGERATDVQNTNTLLRLLATRDEAFERSARFVCVLVAVAPDGTELVARGTVEGTIAREPAGEHGFGYDPVFVPEGHELTFAQLGSDVKATMSHRARAARSLTAQVEQLLGADA